MVIGENAPPIHANCRCSTAPYAESDEEYEKWFYETTGKHSAQWEMDNVNDDYKAVWMNQTKDGNKIKIRSSSSRRRSLEYITEGKASLNQKRQNILDRVPKTGDWQKFKKGQITIKDLAYLSAATKHEFSLWEAKDHLILSHGDSHSCDPVKDLEDLMLTGKYYWVAHSHVDKGSLMASAEDRHTLKELNQKKSTIVGIDGQIKDFGQFVFDDD